MTITTVLDTKSIPGMPKQRKGASTILNRYLWLHKELRRIEKELSRIQKECPQRTRCYLRYGWMFQHPYDHGFPISGEIEEWEHALADFYTMEANKLLRERDKILKKMYRLASRYYNLTGEIVSLGWRYGSHLRKPEFKKFGR